MLSKHFSHSSGECRCEVKTYWLAFLLGITVFFFQLLGSFLSGSLALLADTFHVLNDSLSHLVAILTAYLVIHNPAFEKKFRSFGGIVSSVLMLIISVVIARESVVRIFHPSNVNGNTLLVFAVVGAVGNGLSLWLVHSRTEPNITRTNLLRHILVDLSQSVVVIISAILLLYNPNWVLADPILSLVLAGSTLFLSVKTFQDSRQGF